MAWANSAIWARSCSLAGVTCRANRWPKVSSDVHLRAFPLLMSIKPGARATLRCGLKRPAIYNHRTGIRLAILHQTQDGPQIMGHRFKATSFDPTLGLLINRAP